MKRRCFCKRVDFYFILVLAVLLIWSCKKAPIVYSTTNVKNITGYLEASPDSFSLFREMLEITEEDGFLSAYGHYTLFAPTNQGVNEFLNSQGKKSLNEFDKEELKEIVDFHILEDTVLTVSFTDGKLPNLTLFGQYLVTGALNEDGRTNITINRQANLVTGNVRAGNGIIHIIDNVLIPAASTLAEMIENSPRYSIFSEAIKATGFYDRLNQTPDRETSLGDDFYTLLAESDSALNALGINSFEDLKHRFSNTGDPTDPQDSLNLFVAYHILEKANYMADLITGTSFNTLVPNQVITTKLEKNKILLNDAVFNEVHEPGIAINRPFSDISAKNGVLNDLEGLIEIKVRSPFPVYWDICRYPEIMALPAYYGKQTYEYTLQNLPSFINFSEANYPPTYVVGGDPFVYGDYLAIPIGVRRAPWIEFTTPLLVKGRYKVWICYRTAGRQNINQISIDGVDLPRTLNFGAYMPGSGSEGELLAQGWKNYTYPIQRNWTGYLVGTIDIETTGTHQLRFTNLAETDDMNWLDMIHFIPEDMNQVWPKFQSDGSPVYEDDKPDETPEEP